MTTRRGRRARPLRALVLLLFPFALSAQTGSLRITVTDAATSAPLLGAVLEVRDAAGALVRLSESDRRGEVKVSGLAAASHTVIARLIGYGPERIAVEIAPDEVHELAIPMTRAAVILAPLTVTAHRTEEELLSLPVAMSVVSRQTLERRIALTTIAYLAALPEAQVLSGGLMSRRYTTRGPNAGESANVRTMTDFRYTAIPGINFNADYLVSTTVEDIARAELLRGQGTVSYGPNSSRGILNLITRSPLDDPGTSVSVAAGSRSSVLAVFRQATALSEKVGVKLSGEYFQGNDWLPPGIAKDSAIGGSRLNQAQRLRVDARMDWQPTAATRATFSGGMAQASVFDAVTFGGFPAYLNDGRLWYVQGRVSRGQLKANLFFNKNDLADGSFTGFKHPFKEYSSSLWGQVQHGVQVGSSTSLQYGADLGHTAPESNGTLYGGFEGKANLTELGAFVTASTRLSPKFEATLAGRVDHHSVIGGVGFSPWASVIYTPHPSHAFHLSASRSFFTVGSIGLFSDFPVARVGPLPYSVRTVGEALGRTFRRDCNGGLCMRSPFNPAGAGGPSEWLPADATTEWAAAVALLGARGINISGLPAPTGADVSSVLATLNTATGQFVPTAASDVTDVGGAERRWVTELELGYKGLIGHRLRIGASAYYRDNSYLSSNQVVVTPNVFYDRASLQAYLGRFMPAANATAIAAALSGIPMGTVATKEAPNPTDLQLGQYRIRGIHYWGASLDVEVAITPEFSANAAYGWMSDDRIPGQLGSAVTFNNPTNQVSFGLDYINPRAGLNAGVRGRHLDGYPATNGSASADLPAYTLIDVVVGYRLPHTGIALSVTADNLLDDQHQELPGAPRIGRLVMAGVRAAF